MNTNARCQTGAASEIVAAFEEDVVRPYVIITDKVQFQGRRNNARGIVAISRAVKLG